MPSEPINSSSPLLTYLGEAKIIIWNVAGHTNYEILKTSIKNIQTQQAPDFIILQDVDLELEKNLSETFSVPIIDNYLPENRCFIITKEESPIIYDINDQRFLFTKGTQRYSLQFFSSQSNKKGSDGSGIESNPMSLIEETFSNLVRSSANDNSAAKTIASYNFPGEENRRLEACEISEKVGSNNQKPFSFEDTKAFFENDADLNLFENFLRHFIDGFKLSIVNGSNKEKYVCIHSPSLCNLLSKYLSQDGFFRNLQSDPDQIKVPAKHMWLFLPELCFTLLMEKNLITIDFMLVFNDLMKEIMMDNIIGKFSHQNESILREILNQVLRKLETKNVSFDHDSSVNFYLNFLSNLSFSEEESYSASCTEHLLWAVLGAAMGFSAGLFISIFAMGFSDGFSAAFFGAFKGFSIAMAIAVGCSSGLGILGNFVPNFREPEQVTSAVKPETLRKFPRFFAPSGTDTSASEVTNVLALASH